VAHYATASKSPNDRGQQKPSRAGRALRPRRFTTPSSSTDHATLRYVTSPPSRPLKGMEGGRALPSKPALTGANTPHWPHKDQGDNSQTPSLSHAAPTRQHRISGVNGYETHHPNTDRQDTRMTPPTTGWDPCQGSRLETFLAGEVPRPQRSGLLPSSPREDQANDDPGWLPTTGMTPWETWRRQQRPRWMSYCSGQLTNHHCGYSAAMASTVAPCQPLAQHGRKTMMRATPWQTLEEDVACKLS
jgi:hypothetical protein